MGRPTPQAAFPLPVCGPAPRGAALAPDLPPTRGKSIVSELSKNARRIRPSIVYDMGCPLLRSWLAFACQRGHPLSGTKETWLAPNVLLLGFRLVCLSPWRHRQLAIGRMPVRGEPARWRRGDSQAMGQGW